MTIRHTGCRFAVSCTSHGSSWSFVVTSRSIRVDSCRFDNIFNPYRRHLRLLQIDFRYAFPCHKRWFLRLPVSHHHWAANRPPVWRFVNCLWRFAAVWVYWTTLTAWRRFLTFKPYGCDRATSFASCAVSIEDESKQFAFAHLFFKFLSGSGPII